MRPRHDGVRLPRRGVGLGPFKFVPTRDYGFNCRMSLPWRLMLVSGGFASGFLLHAWSPWAAGKTPVRKSAPLAEMHYADVARDPGLEQKAARFLSGMDTNYPASATEHLLAIVMLHERYGEPHLSGYQVGSYANRYIDAQALLTAHLLQGAPSVHRDRVARLRVILTELNWSEAEYCAVGGGTGAYRDRRTEHMVVEDMVSRWALRLAQQPGSTNPDPRKSFRVLFQRLADDQAILRKDYANNPDDLAFVLKGKSTPRSSILAALGHLTDELKAWPPAVAEELAPLILRTFQE